MQSSRARLLAASALLSLGLGVGPRRLQAGPEPAPGSAGYAVTKLSDLAVLAYPKAQVDAATAEAIAAKLVAARPKQTGRQAGELALRHLGERSKGLTIAFGVWRRSWHRADVTPADPNDPVMAQECKDAMGYPCRVRDDGTCDCFEWKPLCYDRQYMTELCVDDEPIDFQLKSPLRLRQNVLVIQFGSPAPADVLAAFSTFQPCSKLEVRAGSRPDAFATQDGAEQPFVGTGLGAHLGARHAPFDGAELHVPFGCTLRLPKEWCITGATLEFVAKPLGSSEKDSLQLSFLDASGKPVSGTPVWTASFGPGGSGPGLGKVAWSPATVPAGQSFKLDLAALPGPTGSMNLLPALNAQKTVDLEGRDCTSFDHILMRVTVCPCGKGGR